MIDEKNAKKTGTVSDKTKPDAANANAKTTVETQTNALEEKKAAAVEVVKKTLEDRQKVIEERKKEIVETRGEKGCKKIKKRQGQREEKGIQFKKF